eukprot:342542-Pyramimonas_sp.AAC.1
MEGLLGWRPLETSDRTRLPKRVGRVGHFTSKPLNLPWGEYDLQGVHNIKVAPSEHSRPMQEWPKL